MDIIIRRRGNGKTTYVLGLLAEDPKTILVCFSEQEAKRVQDEIRLSIRDVRERHEKAKELTSRVVSISQLPLLGKDVNLILDNAEIILNQLFNNPVSAITLTDAELK